MIHSPLQTFPDSAAQAANQARQCPICLGILEASQQRRRCWQPIPAHKEDTWELQSAEDACRAQALMSDPVVGAAPPALIVFVPHSLITSVPSMHFSSLQRDRGTNPNFDQVMQEARTGTAQSPDR